MLPIGYSDIKEVIKTGGYVDKTQYAQEIIEKKLHFYNLAKKIWKVPLYRYPSYYYTRRKRGI